MRKTEFMHIRIEPDVKKQCEDIFNALGINTSYAVSMFFKQVIRKNGFPFELIDSSKEEKYREEKLAYAINSTAAKQPSYKIRKIIHLYAKKDIDYDTALYAIKKEFR